jgi:lysophospholipase L1-like esterase
MHTLEPAPYLRNCIDVVREGEAWLPLRFTPSQLARYAATDAARIRSRCTSGVCVDLLSDSTQLLLHYRVGEAARDWAYFDCLVDGALIDSAGTMPIDRRRRCATFRVPSYMEPGMHRFTVYLPHLVELFVESLYVEDGSRAEPAPDPTRRILCTGDSITQGMSSLRPSSAYPVCLARALEAELLNLGVGGYVFDVETVERVEAFVPDLITVAYGTNDWTSANSCAEIRRNCAAYLARLRTAFPRQQVWVISPIWRADIEEPKTCGTFGEMVNAIRDSVSEHAGMHLVDGIRLAPHLPECFGDQTLHPNDEGFFRMAQNLMAHLRPALSSLQ